MSACCSIPTVAALPCPSCGEIGPSIGVAPVRPHYPDAADGAWQHCATPGCAVVYYLDATTVDVDSVITRVGSKAADQPTPVCFCFAHTTEDLLADAAAHDGVSTIKAEIKEAVADGRCACEHLNPSTRCCLADVHRTLTSASTTGSVATT